MEGTVMRERIDAQSSNSQLHACVEDAGQQPVAAHPHSPDQARDEAATDRLKTGDKSKKASRSSGIDRLLADLPLGGEVAVGQVQPCGTLMARRWKNGTVLFFWRATFQGKLIRVEIGIYSDTANRTWRGPTPEGAYSVAAAQARAAEIALEHSGALPLGGYTGLLEAKQRAVKAAADREDRLSTKTLAAMLKLYWQELLRLRKKSANEVRCALVRNVIEASPLAVRPANQITDDDIATLLGPIYRAGSGRQANKVRAYLHAAYTMAINARLDGDLPQSLKEFGVRRNPVAATPANGKYNRPDKNPLTTADIRTYWGRIEHLGGLPGRALRLHLLCGAPRIQQFVEARRSDLMDKALVLWDGKGRPGGEKRRHVLPLMGKALEDMRAIDKSGDFLFSTDGGKKHISNTTLSQWAVDAVGTTIDGFLMKRVRSGVETLLSSQSVPMEHRGHLQSHGVNGVQAKHYDGYEFYWEKADALEILHECLMSEEVPQPKRAPGSRAAGSLSAPNERSQTDRGHLQTDTSTVSFETTGTRPGLRLVVSNSGK